MTDEQKTKQELIQELDILRQRVADLEQSELAHKQAEEALRESEDRYRDLVEFSQYLICTHDLKGQILSMNQGAAKLMGYDSRFILNNNLRDFLAPEVRGEFDTYLSTIQKQGVAKGVMLIQTATGEKRFWEYNNTLRTEGILEPIVRGMAHDITERKKMEQALIENEKVSKRLSQENAIMAEIGRIVSSTLNIEEVYELFAKEVRKLIPFDRIMISMVNLEKGTGISTYMAGKGVPDRQVRVPYSLEGTAIAEMIRTKSTLLVQTEDLNEGRNRFPKLVSTFEAGFRSIMNVPLFAKGQIIGGLLLRSCQSNAYETKDVQLAERVGSQIAGAVANAQLYIERKQAEEALRQGEEKYRTILENIEDGYYEVDLTGNFTFFNDSLCRMLGYSKDEMIGMGNQQYTDQENRKKLFEAVNRVYRTGEPKTGFDWEVIRKDGVKVVGEASVSLIKDSNGQPIGFRGIARDITERKRMEELLRESEERYRIATEGSNDGVAIVKNLAHVYVNQSFLHMFGYDHVEEIVGKPAYFNVHPNDRERVKNYALMRVKGEDLPTKYEFKGITKDGISIDVEVSVNTIFYQGERAVLAYLRDITERKRMEQEQLKTEKLQSLGILAGGIAHDFNNLLTSIMGNIDFAKSFLKRGDKIFDLLERAETSSLRASDLAKQLITFSEGGTPVRKTVLIGDVLKSAVSFALAGSNVMAAFHISDGPWPVEIDEGQMRQAIHSMVLNVRDAIPKGGVVFLSTENVKVSLKDGLPLKEGDYVRISIKDEGIGIPAENIPRIFDPYFTTKEMGNQKGMGLGLSISHSIVKNHQGAITVESMVGVGTTFHIYLPAASEKVDEERGEGKISRRKKVLVMDDEEEVRKFLEEILEDAGYEAAFAREGSETLKLYQEAKEAQRPFDAVILDLTVPGGMSGEETIKRLLEMNPEVKAVVSSGYPKDPIMLKFKEYGFKVALAKPYKISTLKRVLSEVTG